ncbi:DUF4262 domain-containing protein [Blastococcus sp. BMG 814]|uniref:DUF4262 domain-containing protein n=1 Tax=Blastococcus carthaginiensis TaxID=3050034 RepID=A0ABT9IC34_9ACTN|nr:DUF4262 domain-containing protein [Blastococcus carthaginiensis]MDP5183124.1 DUF4262 domain-containing protein [Blastococcus carthaginiensis]
MRFRRKRAAKPGSGEPTGVEQAGAGTTGVEPVEGGPVEGGPVEGGPVEGGPVEAQAAEAAPVEAQAAETAPVEGEQDADQGLGGLRRVIDEFGWAVLHGGGTPGEPRYSYTVGLSAWQHPEVVVVGLPFPAAEKYLNLVGEAVRAGARFAPGTATTALTDEDSPVVFLRVEDTARLAVVEELHGTVDALQLIWPDSAGRLPWQEGHRNPPGTQPLLGPLPGDQPTGG